MSETLWVDPAAIEFRITPSADLKGEVSGNWDIERRKPFIETAKYRTMVEHFIDGRPWEETTLFTDAYVRRMANDGHIGGIRTIAGVVEHYRNRFDPMVEAFRKDGFSLAGANGKPHALPSFLIGRGAEVFIGNQGNHRLAIARAIGLDKIAGRVVCRHR